MLLALLPARARVAVAVSAVCVAALTGCSGGGGGSSPSPSPSSASPSPRGGALITIKDFAFHPASLTVAAGTKITVTNKDAATHTVTATGDKAFDTGQVKSGQTVTFTAPARPGSYPYICTIHPTMNGTLTVR
ncbi:cupredoxin domain-containing protein [Streptomyces sp. NBC_00876]|uniref:cupredoxin domain-containing protein n=1 Tax=Streptomyces sp. NBC_00876 TaxID=2975853 RepID=UPI003864918D|nr:cupredoxin domain-containing protein [Streptomyces sp. NBC_00876]